MDIRQEKPKRIHGLNDAVQLLLRMTKDVHRRRSVPMASQGNKKESFKKVQEDNKAQQSLRKGENSINRIANSLRDQKPNFQPDTRVKQAAQSHQRTVNNSDNNICGNSIFKTNVSNQEKSSSILNPQVKQQRQVVQNKGNIIPNLIAGQQLPLKPLGDNFLCGNDVLPNLNIFDSNYTKSVKTNLDSFQSKSQFYNQQKATPENNILFRQNSNMSSNLFVKKPETIEFQKAKTENIMYYEPNKNIFKHNVLQKAEPSNNISSLSSGSPEIFGFKANFNMGKKVEQNSSNLFDIQKNQGQRIQTENNYKQSVKQTPVNIFSTGGVFQHQGNQKNKKPVLIFNNNIFTKSIVVKNTQQKSSVGNIKTAQPIKFTFKNNISTLETVKPTKPTLNIFGGNRILGKQPVKQIQIQEVKKAQQSLQNDRKNIPNAPKMELQQAHPQVKPGQLSQNANFSQNVLQNPQISHFRSNPQKNVISNDHLSQPQQKPAFSIQKKVGLFQKNLQIIPQQKSSIFQSFQKSKIKSSKTSQFGITQSKPQNTSLFFNNNSLSHKEQEPLKTNLIMNTGLFGTPSRVNDLFSHQNNINSKSQPLFVPQAAKKEGQSKQTKQVNSYTKKQQSNQSILSQNNQKLNLPLEGNQTSDQNKLRKIQNKEVGNIFRRNVPEKYMNPFAKIESQPNMPSSNSPADNIFKSSSQGGSPFTKLGQGNNFLGNKGDRRGATLFDKKDNQDEDQQVPSGEEDDDWEQPSQQPQQTKGQMKFANYLQTTIYARVQALKFKIASTGKLVENIRISLQKFSDAEQRKDEMIYLIVRNSNKTLAYYGILTPISEVKIMSQKQATISISIQNVIQIDVRNNNQKSRQTWRLQFKESIQAKQFVSECRKTIQRLQASNSFIQEKICS